MDKSNEDLRGYFVPYLLAPSHFLPLLQIAKLFSSRGVHVTFLTTPHTSSLLRQSLGDDHPLITLELVDFPAKEVGLPEGVETYSSATSLETAGKLFFAFIMLQQPMEEKIRAARPDFIVADMHCFWASDLGIPRLVYHGQAFFALCAAESISLHSPYLAAKSDSDPFILPGLPGTVKMTRSELSTWIHAPNRYTEFAKKIEEGDRKSYGVLVNSFEEFESDYAHHYRAALGHKSWPIGPIQLHCDVVFRPKPNCGTLKSEKHPCLQWLDQMGERKVVYVNFGSMSVFGSAQLFEIASALESSGHPFIWAVRNTVSSEDEWLPAGFEERIAARNLGVLIRGWAPQVEILEHRTIGGFVTHCGWNSMVEAVQAGVPMVAWPLSAEHFYNRRLVMDVFKIGVDIGNTKWGPMIEESDELMESERIEKAVRELMSETNEAMERRRRAAELGNAARKAVEEGGSSRTNLTAVIEELRGLKMGR